MKRTFALILGCSLPLVFSVLSFASEVKILTNHLGYELNRSQARGCLGKSER